MPRRREPEPEPDPRLDRYRRGAARVYDGDSFVGVLATRVQVWWTVEGRWPRRHGVNPVERIEWLLAFDDPWPGRRADGWDDAVVSEDETESLVGDWDAGHFRYGDRLLRVDWLAGPDAAAAYASVRSDRD